MIDLVDGRVRRRWADKTMRVNLEITYARKGGETKKQQKNNNMYEVGNNNSFSSVDGRRAGGSGRWTGLEPDRTHVARFSRYPHPHVLPGRRNKRLVQLARLPHSPHRRRLPPGHYKAFSKNTPPSAPPPSPQVHVRSVEFQYKALGS